MKVKQLIKKLSELDPEANVYFGAGTVDTKPIVSCLTGTRMKREGFFLLPEEINRLDQSTESTNKSMVNHLIKRYGMKSRADLHGKDILITNWNGKRE